MIYNSCRITQIKKIFLL